MVWNLIAKWLQNFFFFPKVFGFGIRVVSFVSVELKKLSLIVRVL